MNSTISKDLFTTMFAVAIVLFASTQKEATIVRKQVLRKQSTYRKLMHQKTKVQGEIKKLKKKLFREQAQKQHLSKVLTTQERRLKQLRNQEMCGSFQAVYELLNAGNLKTDNPEVLWIYHRATKQGFVCESHAKLKREKKLSSGSVKPVGKIKQLGGK